MIRVAYDITAWTEAPFGGIAQTCLQTLRQAAAQPDIQAVGYFRRGRPRPGLPPETPARRYGLTARLLDGPFDIAHSLCHRSLPLRCRRSVYTVHDAWSLQPNRWQSPAFQAKLGRRLRKDLGRADFVIANSRYTQEQLKKLGAVEPGRCAVVHFGVAAATPVVAQAAPDIFAGLDPQTYVLFVGRLERRKNLPHVCAAVKPLERLKLVLIGEPGFGYEDHVRPALDAFPRDRKLTYRRLPLTDLAWLYRHALATLLPSWEEGFGLPVLEAMAHASPVITSDCSAIPEVAAGAALLIDPEQPTQSTEALQRLADDSALRDRLARAGTERAAAMTWEKYFAGVRDVYRRLLP